MAWELKERWFHVRFENEFGQFADGSSSESYEEAEFRAKVEASTLKPPVYRPPLAAAQPRPTINDL